MPLNRHALLEMIKKNEKITSTVAPNVMVCEYRFLLQDQMEKHHEIKYRFEATYADFSHKND